MRGASLALLLALAGCQAAQDRADRPVAAGSVVTILNASRAARSCGVRDTRLQPIGGRRAVLRIGTRHSDGAETCLVRWLADHPRGLDPALLDRVTDG